MEKKKKTLYYCSTPTAIRTKTTSLFLSEMSHDMDKKCVSVLRFMFSLMDRALKSLSEF